jgi:Na+:H+ antiporter, NhaA family
MICGLMAVHETGDYVDIDHGSSSDIVAGLFLVAAAILAIVWVNIDVASYSSLWDTSAALGSGSWQLDFDLRQWINEGLMTIFFLVVGLEVKQAITTGELRDRQHRTLPLAGAVGGMVAPAFLYWIFTRGTSGASGWAIPMATDIAVAAGVVALLGRRVPAVLRACLLSLAIVDDIGSVIVIAVFYGKQLNLGWVAVFIALIAATFVVLRTSVFRLPALSSPVLAVVGAVLWLALFRAGIHPTLAGVAVGLLAPVELIPSWERTFGTAARLIVPLFALANTGILLSADAFATTVSSPVGRGVIVGLVIGKPLGISAMSWVAVRVGMAKLPPNIRWVQFVGISALGGIGFTVALFIAELSFSGSGSAAESAASGVLEDSARLAILIATVISAVLGCLVISLTNQLRANGTQHHENPLGTK